MPTKHSIEAQSTSNIEVGVCIPAYNDEKFIEYTLASLIGQTHKNISVHVIDDCSTDSTGTIAQRFGHHFEKFKYTRHNKNMGISYTMKEGIMSADTKYFMWLGDDDIISSGYIEACLKALERNRKAVIAFTIRLNIDESGETLEVRNSPSYSGKCAIKRLTKYIVNSDDACGYGLLRRDVIQDVKFPVWKWPNKHISYNNIYPSILYYLSKGDYCHVPGAHYKKRIKNKANHYRPIFSNSLLLHMAFILRRLNLYLYSIMILAKSEKYYLVPFLAPLMFIFWVINPIFKETLLPIRSLLLRNLPKKS